MTESERSETFEANCAVLARTAPELVSMLESTGPGELTVEESASGVPTARVRGTYVHSRHDPAHHARRVVDAGVGENASTIVILGFGLGYRVEAALDARPEASVVVVIDSVADLATAVSTRDLQDVLGNERLVLLVVPEPHAVVHALRNHADGELAVLGAVHAAGTREYWQEVEAAIATFRQRREINRNTLIRFGKLWVRNLSRNIAVFAASRPVKDLAGIAAGLPALVLGAGPTLDDVLPHLISLRERMIIIAVDTALGPCLDAGVDPDVLVVVDPQYWNTRHLDRKRPENTILISESSTHSRVFKLFGHLPTFFCSSLFPLGEYLEEVVGERGRLGAGGSVSTTAWDAARFLGCTTIVTAGVDLGFPGRATHCRGSFFEERTHLLSSRLEPAETLSFSYLWDADPYVVEATDGSPVLTDKRMVIYRWWFENQVAMHPEISARTASPRGVKIPGVLYADIESLCAMPTVRDTIDAAFADAVRRSVRSVSVQESLLSESLGRLDTMLSDLEKASEKALAIVEVAEGSPDPGPVLEELDTIDRQISAVGNRRIPSFLMQDVIADITEGGAGDPIVNSRRVYSALLESVRYHRRYLTRGGS